MGCVEDVSGFLGGEAGYKEIELWSYYFSAKIKGSKYYKAI